jgi:hypothetical protein
LTHFKIITCVWGAPKEWLTLTVDSIANQDYEGPYEACVVIDDAMSTPELGAAVMFRHDFEGHVFDILERRGIVQNQWEFINWMCDSPEDVVVWVDGDGDQLVPDALSYLDEVYTNSDVLMTYGNYDSWPPSPTSTPARPWPPEVVVAGTYREHARFGGGICHNHLRTMKYGLIQQMDESDMKRADGRWVRPTAPSCSPGWS